MLNSTRDGCLPTFSTGTGERKRRSGGSISASVICQPKICWRNAARYQDLVLWAQSGGTAKAPIHRYSFPEQDTDLRDGDELRSLGGAKFGTVDAISFEHRTIDIKKRKDTADFHPEAVFAHQVIDSKVLANALVRIGRICRRQRHYRQWSLPSRARSLDARTSADRRPSDKGSGRRSTLTAAMRIAPHLERRRVSCAGPARSRQNSYRRAHDLHPCAVRQEVGVTANSHKVIRNLLDEVIEAADELARADSSAFRRSRKWRATFQGCNSLPTTRELLSAIGTNCQVAGATAWLWARPDAFESVDVLFIDEAAQMSLANVLAVSQAAKTHRAARRSKAA